MSVLESILSVIAPHDCLVCGEEGKLLCANCQTDAVPHIPSRCYRCHKISQNYKTCRSCRSSSNLHAVIVRTEYAATAKDLLYLLKFQRAKAASVVIGGAMSQKLNAVSPNSIVIPIPTSTRRRRQRGYDQADLLAKQLCSVQNSDYVVALHRKGQERQVGARRQVRLKQLEQSFWVNEKYVKDRNILLVDDVITTGATLETAAAILKNAGARRVSAIVFAQA